MAHDIAGREVGKGQPTDIGHDLTRFDQAGFLPARQVNLGDIAGDDGFCTDADAGEEHFHLLRRGVLRLVENDEGMMQSASAHVGQRGDFDMLFLEEFGHLVKTHQVIQRIVERTQVGIDFLCQVARQKAQPLAGFNSRAGEYQSTDLVAFQCVDRSGDGEIGFAGAGRADAEGDVMREDIVEVSGLVRRASVQPRFSGHQACVGQCRTGLGAVDFDQAELQVVNRQRLTRQGIEVLQCLCGQTGLRQAAADLAMATTAGDGDIESCLDLAQVFVERAAEILQQIVILRLQGQGKRAGWRVQGLLLAYSALSMSA